MVGLITCSTTPAVKVLLTDDYNMFEVNVKVNIITYIHAYIHIYIKDQINKNNNTYYMS